MQPWKTPPWTGNPPGRLHTPEIPTAVAVPPAASWLEGEYTAQSDLEKAKLYILNGHLLWYIYIDYFTFETTENHSPET